MMNQERTYSILAHLTVMLNMVTLILGTVAALVLYLIFRKRSPLVAFHALQSLLMQLVIWVGGVLIALSAWLLSGALGDSIAAICIMPVAFLLSLLPMIAVGYGALGAIEVNLGNDFRYYRFGNWALELMRR